MHWESCELSAGVLRWLISSLATELLCQPQGIVPMWPWEAGAGGASSLFPFTSSVRLGLGTAPCGLALSSGSARPFLCWVVPQPGRTLQRENTLYVHGVITCFAESWILYPGFGVKDEGT